MRNLVLALGRRMLRNPRLRRFLSRAYVKVNAHLRRRRVVLDAAFDEGRWQDFVDLVRRVEASPWRLVSPTIYVRLSAAYAQLGDVDAARATFRRAERRMPWSDLVLRGVAEWAMHEEDYPRAVVYWQRFAMATENRSSARAPRRAAPFPVRGSDIDWYERAWIRVVEGWDEWWAAAGKRPSALMYARMLATMVACDHPAGLAALGEKALRDWPDDPVLALRVYDALVQLAPGVGSSVVDQLPTLGDGPSVRAIRAEMAGARSLLDDLRRRGPTHPGEVRVLNVAHLSGADFLVRSSNYWDTRRIADEAMCLSRRDRWPEGFSDIDLLSHTAMEISRKFAAGRGRSIGVPDDALARAAFHFIKHELCLKLPADRIAREVARTCADEPVFVELPSLRMEYLASYPTSRFQQVYLYAALRALGCNVYFVRFPTRAGRRLLASSHRRRRAAMPPLVFAPRVDGLRPRFVPLTDGPEAHRVLVPAGVRSVGTVHALLDPTLVINSAAVIQEYAYDRSFRQTRTFPVHAELHPDARLLPRIRCELTLTDWWTRSRSGLTRQHAEPRDDARVEVSLATGVAWSGDWYGLLEQVLLPYFGAYVGKADTFLAEHGIDEVHVSDYLYAEPTLLAARVKERGGSVHLWPHSTNPVHVQLHDTALIDSVRAVTRSGAEVWRSAAPHAAVHQVPQLMLRPSTERVAWTPDEPLSVVVIGGRPKLRNLPILDIAAHEETYRSFFEAAAPLVAEGLVRMYFKPRGLTGEHESWLDSVVGRAADWTRILAHPSRIDLPNPLYVSVSVASSALLEGLARGIPALVVRGAYARDYLAADDGTIEAVTVDEVADRLKTLTHAEAWARLRDAQSDALVRETTPDPGVTSPLDGVVLGRGTGQVSG